jgi:hypothetical protein
MKNSKLLNRVLTISCLALIISFNAMAQVGVNTTTPNPSAALHIESSDKGIMLPKVALTGTDDVTTITPSPTTGLMVYNTATAGLLPGGVSVTPGFYYWNGSSWRRFRNQGFTLNYEQSAAVTASTNNLTYVILPGLDTGNITVPFSGTYQIRLEAYYAAGNHLGGSNDGAAQGSISLALSTAGGAFVTLKETYLTTSSKDVLGTKVNNLAQSATIIWNMDLAAGTTYRFAVRGREWLPNDVGTGSFGRDTSGYAGSPTNNAQRGSMTITLVKQQ